MTNRDEPDRSDPRGSIRVVASVGLVGKLDEVLVLLRDSLGELMRLGMPDPAKLFRFQ